MTSTWHFNVITVMYGLYYTFGQIICSPHPMTATIYSSFHHVISCSSSSSLYITSRNKLTLTTSMAMFSQNYWTQTFQNIWQWQMVEGMNIQWKKNHLPTHLDPSVKTKIRRQEAVRFKGNVILWEIWALTTTRMSRGQ